jgi:4-amino-4-deoxy-L-arabinose transferase-like glycosyltransferase
LPLSLHLPIIQDRNFKVEASLDGRDFLYKNDASKILFRTRMAAAVLSLLLAILLFAWTREMFGTLAAFLALILLVFDPNILAHGALVTTDMGLTCFMFATIYAFYRYMTRPSWARLSVVGVCAGLALASKHSAILIFPILLLLGAAEVVCAYCETKKQPQASRAISRTGRHALTQAAAILAVVLLAVVVLWSAYGFRYASRPGTIKMNPALDAFAARMQRPSDVRAIAQLAHLHLLPEAYIFGLVDVRNNADFTPSYIFGAMYPQGQWFYFPAIVLIKSTLALLLLLLSVPLALALRLPFRWREALFLIVPPAFFFLSAMQSGMNRGVRHILPIYPFLIILAAAGSCALIRYSRRWDYIVAALVVCQIATSIRVSPAYIAYANEAWGGPANTYKYFTDSNVDWAQQLIGTSQYLRQSGISQCWFAYYAGEIVDSSYYGIPCKQLPTISVLWAGSNLDIPTKIHGPVLVSSSLISGFEFGGGELNPYAQFQTLHPTAVIEHSVFVYEGEFDISAVAAMNLAARSWQLGDTKPQEALANAQAAVALAPRSTIAQASLGDALWTLGKHAEAAEAYKIALNSARTVQPDFQKGWIPYLQGRLSPN